MKKTIFMASTTMILFTGCTYNISMAHTEGQANDVIDDTQSNQPNVSPDVNLTPVGM